MTIYQCISVLRYACCLTASMYTHTHRLSDAASLMLYHSNTLARKIWREKNYDSRKKGSLVKGINSLCKDRIC